MKTLNFHMFKKDKPHGYKPTILIKIHKFKLRRNSNWLARFKQSKKNMLKKIKKNKRSLWTNFLIIYNMKQSLKILSWFKIIFMIKYFKKDLKIIKIFRIQLWSNLQNIFKKRVNFLASVKRLNLQELLNKWEMIH